MDWNRIRAYWELVWRAFIAIWSVIFIDLIIKEPKWLEWHHGALNIGFLIVLLNFCAFEHWEFKRKK